MCTCVRMYKHICTGEMSIANKSVITNQTWKKRSLPSPSPWPLPLVWPVIPSLHPPLLSLSLWRARARYTYTSMHAYTQACMPRHISTYVLCHTCVYKQILPAHTHTHTHSHTHTHTHTLTYRTCAGHSADDNRSGAGTCAPRCCCASPRPGACGKRHVCCLWLTSCWLTSL